MAKIGTLTADLRLESAAFMRDLKKSSEAVASNTNQMRKSMAAVQQASMDVRRSFTYLRDAIVGTFVVREVVKFGQSALDTADKVAKTADMLGLTTDTLQKYQVAAGLSGIQTENFSRSLRTFVSYLGQARTGFFVFKPLITNA